MKSSIEIVKRLSRHLSVALFSRWSHKSFKFALLLDKLTYNGLHDFLAPCGEFLSVTYENQKGYLFNILTIAEDLNALNTNLSTKNEFNELQSIEFNSEALKNIPIFRAAFDNYMGIYCQDELKQRIDSLKLNGLISNADLGNIFPPDNTAMAPKAH